MHKKKVKTIEAKTTKVKKDKTHQAKASKVKKRTNQAETQRFAHHCAENQTVRIPLYREPVLKYVVQGFDTECGNSEGNARSPVNLDLKSKNRAKNNKTNTNTVMMYQNRKYGNVNMKQLQLLPFTLVSATLIPFSILLKQLYGGKIHLFVEPQLNIYNKVHIDSVENS